MAPFAAAPYAPSQPYDDSGSARITDIILRAGEARARAAERSGELWGQTVAGLGQQAGEAIAVHQAAQAEKKRKAQLGEMITRVSREGYDFAKESVDIPPELRPAAFEIFNKVQTSRSEAAKRTAEIEKLTQEAEAKKLEVEDEQKYQFATAAAGLRAAIGTPFEDLAKMKLFGMFAQEYPEQVQQFATLSNEELIPVLDGQIQGSQKFLKEQAEIQAKQAEPGYKERQLAEQARGHELTAETARRGQDLNAAQAAAALAETKRGHDLQYGGGAGTAGGEEASFLLQGGTADKIPIKGRAAAVEAARASGGVDGTGFVPANTQQQTKYSDFMDLRSRAQRLKTLLADPEVQAQLGPGQGRFTGATKELPFFGASTKVKEAFDLMENFSDTALRKRSGAQISPGEYQRITGFTVSKTKQADSNLTNLDRMSVEIDDALRRIGAKNLPAAAGASAQVSPAEADILKRYGY